jgi:hypothetical protein
MPAAGYKDTLDHKHSRLLLLVAALAASVHLSTSPYQIATCADVRPVSAPGMRFACPTDSEFNPLAANTTLPDEAKCCKVRTRHAKPIVHESIIITSRCIGCAGVLMSCKWRTRVQLC